MNAKRQAWLFACLLFLAAFFLYVITFCSSLYPDDSGETATLAWTLSIGHPPGYPLHTLFARIFTLIPLGDPALRVNLLAALLAAICAPLIFACTRSLSRNSTAIFSALLLCLGPVFWHNALVAKGSVYMLNNALTLGMLAVLLSMQGPTRARLFFLLLGLGLAHHYMSQTVMLPCYALLLYNPPWRKNGRQIAWILPGLSLYAFLFIRAAQQPPINWGEIKTFSDFIFFLSRAQYAAAEISRTLATSLGQLIAAWTYVAGEGRWAGLLLALAALWQFRVKFLQALALGVLAPIAAVTFYLNLQGERLAIMEPYLFPAYICAAILAGLGLDLVLKLQNTRMKLGLSALFLVNLLAPLKTSLAVHDKSSYFFATDNARSVLQSLPRNAVLFSAGDAIIFPLWYLQKVKHERKDVALVGTPVLPMNWVRDDLKRDYPAILQPRISGPIGAESIDRLVATLLEMNKNSQQLYFSYNQMNAGVTQWKLLPQGPVYRALPQTADDPKNAKQIAENNLMAASYRGFESAFLDNKTQKLMVGDYAIHHNSLGTWLEERRDFEGAMKHYLLAITFNTRSEEFPFNVGNALHELGQKDAAIAWYQRSISLNPRYENAWFNLAATQFMLNRNAEGCMALKKTLEINPQNHSALAQKPRCQNLQ